MHRASDIKVDTVQPREGLVSWEDSLTAEQWLATQDSHQWKTFFDKNGYLKVENILSTSEVEKYKELYQKMLDGEIDTSSHRHDLGNHVERTNASQENICQIMWPSLYVEGLQPHNSPVHARVVAISKMILGDDMDFDFDMLIYKAPYSKIETPWHQDQGYWPDMPDGRAVSAWPPHNGSETPWHQDQGYWPDMPDKRAVSAWVSLDVATVDNGCMWFVPGSHHEGVRPHRPVAAGKHVLTCDVNADEGVAVPLAPGSCTFHHGRTAHHTGPNTTNTHRRAYIINTRPRAMVEYERSLGYDHGKKGLDGTIGKTKSHNN